MASFSPPIYKPGNKKCPNCGDTGNWERLPLQTLWSGWRCRKCHAHLRWNIWRKVMVVPMWVLLFAICCYMVKLLWRETTPSWVLWIPGIVPMASLWVLLWWLDSVEMTDQSVEARKTYDNE